jgi:hypothetical protein
MSLVDGPSHRIPCLERQNRPGGASIVGGARALCVRDGWGELAGLSALECVPSELFGICAVGVDGAVYASGDADVEFAT